MPLTARQLPPRRPGHARRLPPGGEGRSASLRTVEGQREPCLLAQRLQVFPRQHRPVGVGIIRQQDAFVGEGVDEGAFAFGSGPHRERPRKRGLLLIRVHLRVGRGPDVGEVSMEHRGAGSPSSASAARAIDSALDSARAAARGSVPGKSVSQARSLVILRPGLTSTS